MTGASDAALRRALRLALDQVDRRAAAGEPIADHLAALIALAAELVALQDLDVNARAQLGQAVDVLDDALGGEDGVQAPSHGWYCTGWGDGMAAAAAEIEAERARRGLPPSTPPATRRLS